MNEDFEHKLLNYLYYDLNRLRYFVRDEIFEYDIQSSIHQFLMLNYRNKNVLVQREREGRTDHIIQEKDENGNAKHCTLIELKSFIKRHERLTLNKIESDIKKLNEKISKNVIDTEGYLIIAIKENHLNSTNRSLLNFVEALNNKRIYNFTINGNTVKARIKKSRKTSFCRNSVINVHKDQIRLFMFQIKIKTN